MRWLPQQTERRPTSRTTGFGAFHTLAVIDLVGQKQLPFIDLGALRGPARSGLRPRKGWFTGRGRQGHRQLRPCDGKIDWIMGTGQNRTPHALCLSRAKRILTTNVSSATVTNHEQDRRARGNAARATAGHGARWSSAGSGWTAARANAHAAGSGLGTDCGSCGRGSEGFRCLPDGQRGLGGERQDGTLSVIDIAAKQVTATLAADVPGPTASNLRPMGSRCWSRRIGSGDSGSRAQRSEAAGRCARFPAGIQMQA